MAIYTAEIRWGPARTRWDHDPAIRLTCRDLDDLDDALTGRLLSFVPAGNEAVLQIVADTEHGSFTVAEYTGEAADLDAQYRAGRQGGFTSAGARTAEAVEAARTAAATPPSQVRRQ